MLHMLQKVLFYFTLFNPATAMFETKYNEQTADEMRLFNLFLRETRHFLMYYDNDYDCYSN